VITESELQRPAADALAAALAQFPRDTAAALRRMGRLNHWNDGDVVLRAGTPAASALMIVQGRLRLATASAEGKEVLFRWFTPGEFVGLVSILGHMPVPVEAVAVGHCETIHFEAEELLRHLRTDAAGALSFAGLISRFTAEITNLFVTHTAGTLEERILAVLARLALHEGVSPSQQDVRLKASHQDIAAAVGASRQRVSLELQKLAASGRIRLGYRHLVLLKDDSSTKKSRAY
jgi:CRP/FNR family cyclic AMP-dependent transcriptional regulator